MIFSTFRDVPTNNSENSFEFFSSITKDEDSGFRDEGKRHGSGQDSSDVGDSKPTFMKYIQ